MVVVHEKYNAVLYYSLDRSNTAETLLTDFGSW